MHAKVYRRIGIATLACLIMTGCSKPAAAPAGAVAHDDHAHDHDEHAGHSLGGWWCDDHGVPEEQCALCNAKLADDFKAKGDWCEQHNRPDSQCFACNPNREAEFAALFEAKAGRKPPKPTDNGG